MKKKFKDILFNALILLFIFLIFKENAQFKKCIIDGCTLFFRNVLPSLFPMFLIQDLLLNYNFFSYLNIIYPLFKMIFKTKMAFSIFLISTLSGTPANAYLVANLVREGELDAQDASIILSYSCFMNPLFLYTMLSTIINTKMALFMILLNYLVSLFIAFCFRKYPYKTNEILLTKQTDTLTNVLAKSIGRSYNLLLIILGTILFYLLLCEGLHYFIHNPLLDCFFNGLLETTGGLSKLTFLNINYRAKILLASLFVSFLGFSIHTQIKNIITDVHISSKPFFFVRLIHTLLFTSICLIIA